jgi:hypothetical protein
LTLRGGLSCSSFVGILFVSFSAKAILNSDKGSFQASSSLHGLYESKMR